MKTIKFFSMAALALVGAVTVGCSSDDNIIDDPQQPASKSNVVTLTTTVSLDGGAQTRALTSGGVKTFAEGEQIALVYRNTSDERVKIESAALADGDITNEGKSATFTFELTDPNRSENVTYIYPAAMANSDGSVNYDALASQDGTLATLSISLDLATYSAAWDGTALPAATLANQLAILALTLKDAAGSNDITSTITGATLSDGTNSYAVTRSATAGPIYVAIQPTSSASIEVTATDGTTDYTKSLTGKTYAAGNGYSVSWRMTAASSVLEGAIDSKFTINSIGTQVYFSKGNLQATYDGTDWTWAFATNQWDYIGDAAGNTSINGDGTVSASNVTVDLFGWVGASNTTWTGAAQYGISNSTTINSTDTYGNVATEALKSDWGNTIGSVWRTLTSAEWTYLFDSSTTTSGVRYAKATVNGVSGVILLPDDWSTIYYSLTSTNTTNVNYTTNSITSSDWTNSLEAHGAVFLPAAGYRDQASVYSAGSSGYYRSSSPYNVDGAYSVSFSSHGLYPADGNIRSDGNSVRLVHE